jgi:O-antigen/teichoic acid export membrane protein
LLACGTRVVGVIVAQALAGALAFVFALRLYGRLRLPRLRASLTAGRELIREAAPIFTMGLVVSFQPYIDANMLTKLAPTEVVGWYGAAGMIAGTLLAPAIIIGGAVYPRLSRATNDPGEFNRLIRTAFRSMLFVSGLAAVGTYLFGNVAVNIVYHRASFAPAGPIVQAFSPLLFIASIDILLGNAIVATGNIKRYARAKVVAVLATTALELFLVRLCQSRFGNGGIGVMLSGAAGELIMFGAALYLLPVGTLNRTAVANCAQVLVAGAGAILVGHSLASAGPFIAIPVTVAAYTLLSLSLGLVNRTDADRLSGLIGRPKPEAGVRMAASIS